MWIDLEGLEQMTNVTIRLADSERTYDEKTLTLHYGQAMSPVELTIPPTYDGQLTVRLGCGSRPGNGSGNESKSSGCQSEEFPVHPLEAIQSLSLRLERTLYHPDDVGKLFELSNPTKHLMSTFCFSVINQSIPDRLFT